MKYKSIILTLAFLIPITVGATPPDLTGFSFHPDIVERWFLDEDGGTRAGQIGGNTLTDNNTVLGGVGFTTTGASFDFSADFESDFTEWLSIADNVDMSQTGDISYSVWVKLESDPATNSSMYIMSKSDLSSGQSYSFWYNDANGTKKLFAEYSDNGGAGSNLFTAFAEQTLTVGTWYHLAMTIDVSTQTIIFYVNATPKVDENNDTATPTSIFNSSTAFEIGSVGVGLSVFDGTMNDAIMTNSAMTASQVSDLFNSYLNPINGEPPSGTGAVVLTGSLIFLNSACQSFTAGICDLWETGIQLDALFALRSELAYIFFATVILGIKWFIISVLIFISTRWLWRIVTRWRLPKIRIRK